MFEKIRGLRSSKNYNDKILSNPPPLLLVWTCKKKKNS
jgi:hypothetical protein